MFQTIENAALTVQTQFGVNYEIGKFTTLRIKWYGINIISWKCVRLAFDVSLTINLCTLCTLNRNRGKSCRHCWPCIAAVVGFWQSQRLGFLPNAALLTFLVSKRVTPKRAPSRLICWIGNLLANLLVSLFLMRFVEACALVKENFVLRVERLLANSSVRRGPTGLKCRHLSSSLLFHYFK